MRLSQAFVARDQMNKQALFDRFGADQKTVDLIKAAFLDGEKRWEEELDVLYGAREATRLKEMLPREV